MITVFCIILCVIGAYNWFAVGVFDFNFIDWIFKGDMYIGAQIIYGIVGIAGLYLVGYLVYNKFSGVNIHAPECMMRKKLQAKKQLKDSKEKEEESDNSDIIEK